MKCLTSPQCILKEPFTTCFTERTTWISVSALISLSFWDARILQKSMIWGTDSCCKGQVNSTKKPSFYIVKFLLM